MPSYDDILYPDLSFSQTHPDRLATIATLMGLSPAPIEHCRVLELGCASGANLIPMAHGLPGSQFVGIDLSARQIARGQAMVSGLGLTNISLQAVDILDVGESFGQFDYIIAHGIYSWVPAPVREKLLDVCCRNLAPNGVAYVSYNVYPGWHVMGAIRNLMLYRTRGVTDPHEKAVLARDALDFLIDSARTGQSPGLGSLEAYAKFLREQRDAVSDEGDSFLLHDELEDVNDPVYFHQFIDRATAHGLQYLAEAELSAVMPFNLPKPTMERVQAMAQDLIEVEQYMDFARSRMFRQSLLIHHDVDVKRTLRPDTLFGLYVSSNVKPASQSPDIGGRLVEHFQLEGANESATLSTDHPATKAALLYLAGTWPRAVAFGELLTVARAILTEAGRPSALPEADDARMLAANLLQAYAHSGRLVELHSWAPQFAAQVSAFPVASPVARMQALRQTRVTSLYHERVSLGQVGSYLVQQLAGRIDREALLCMLVDLVHEGKLSLKEGQGLITSDDQLREVLSRELDHQLRWMARTALLVA
jgi:methyltransferase-like protein/SAM-dependent methyltransferase